MSEQCNWTILDKDVEGDLSVSWCKARLCSFLYKHNTPVSKDIIYIRILKFLFFNTHMATLIFSISSYIIQRFLNASNILVFVSSKTVQHTACMNSLNKLPSFANPVTQIQLIYAWTFIQLKIF